MRAAQNASGSASASADELPTVQRVHRDPLPHELQLWLHALRYTGPDWSYEAPPPPWAAEDFDGDRWLLEPNALDRFQSKLAELDYDDVQPDSRPGDFTGDD